MIRVNLQVGENPLRKHRVEKWVKGALLYTIGQGGEIVAWRSSQPVFYIQPSISSECDTLVGCSLVLLRVMTAMQPSLKLVTIHEDNRLRLFNADDGICINISTHHLFQTKVLGIVENSHTQSRFVLCFDKEKVLIVDVWVMKVIGQVAMVVDSFSEWVAGVVNDKKQLEMLDRQGKTYRRDIGKLYTEAHLDVGSIIFSVEQAQEPLETILLELKQPQPITTSFKKQAKDKQVLIQVEKCLQSLKSEPIWTDIFPTKYIDYPMIQYIMNTAQTPTVSNLHFIKGSELWYWIGCSGGRVLGMPVEICGQEVLVEIRADGFGAVNFVEFVDKMMIVSWANGMFHVYSVENIQFTVQNQLQQQKNQQYPFLVSLQNKQIYHERLSCPVKYRLQIFNIQKGKVGFDRLAFQLLNKQVIIFDALHHYCRSLRGFPDDTRIYTVMEMDEHYGVAHTKGIDVFSRDEYERHFDYEDWSWSGFQFFEEISWKQDYHSLEQKKPSPSGADMMEHCDRYLQSKLDFYSNNSNLHYQTFGLIDPENLNSVMYPTFHFIQKPYTEHTIHSTSRHSATSVLRVKHNTARRDMWNNTSWIVAVNLNRELELLGNQEKPQLELLMQKHFVMFSAFLWDENFVPFLSNLYQKVKKNFLLNRRYTEQGIGKSFVFYFQNQAQQELSSELVTPNAVASTALLQLLASKDLNLTDSMVEVVEYFTTKRNPEQASLDTMMLAKLALSDSGHILKACFNLLMSTALTQKKMALETIYEYFFLNNKKMSTIKPKELGSTETVWLVYLGIGLVYSEQQMSVEEVQILVWRLIQCVDVKNFQYHPDLAVVVLKIFNEGIKKWKPLLQVNTVMKLYVQLFRIFFLYDGLSVVSTDDKKFDFRFERLPPNEIKKMKQHLVKTITYLSKEFINQFLQVLRVEALNQKPHPAYPSVVVEILRQYLKSEKPSTNLVFYVELLLQCLSPMTPHLRKHVQRNVLATLQIMCNYENISFNHTSQKLSVRTDSNIYIYCLRTSKKWRTIPVNEEPSQKSILKMSPKGTYIALLGQRLRIWRLSSGFWSGVLGASSQGWVFQANGRDIQWDESEQKISVIHENPSLSRVYKL